MKSMSFDGFSRCRWTKIWQFVVFCCIRFSSSFKFISFSIKRRSAWLNSIVAWLHWSGSEWDVWTHANEVAGWTDTILIRRWCQGTYYKYYNLSGDHRLPVIQLPLQGKLGQPLTEAEGLTPHSAEHNWGFHHHCFRILGNWGPLATVLS